MAGNENPRKVTTGKASLLGTQTNNQNQKRIHTSFGMIYLKTQHPVCFSYTSVRINNKSKGQNPLYVTHSNQMTLNVTIPFKMKKSQ